MQYWKDSQYGRVSRVTATSHVVVVCIIRYLVERKCPSITCTFELHEVGCFTVTSILTLLLWRLWFEQTFPHKGVHITLSHFEMCLSHVEDHFTFRHMWLITRGFHEFHTWWFQISAYVLFRYFTGENSSFTCGFLCKGNGIVNQKLTRSNETE